MNIQDEIKKILKHKGNEIYIPEYLKEEYKEFSSSRIKLLGNAAKAANKRVFFYNNIKKIFPEEYKKVKDEILALYEIGYGIKRIGKIYNISYSNLRMLFKILEIEIRDSNSSTTQELRKIRSINLKTAYKNRDGWFKTFERKTNKTSKGIQGYYYNNSIKKYVWLRSTYEFIYAKFLDKNNIKWNVEVKTYQLENTTYRPDFFIYKDDKIEKIVEIKGYWSNGIIKTKELSNKLDIDVVIIKDITPYIENQSNYNKEIKLWKEIRYLEQK